MLALTKVSKTRKKKREQGKQIKINPFGAKLESVYLIQQTCMMYQNIFILTWAASFPQYKPISVVDIRLSGEWDR